MQLRREEVKREGRKEGSREGAIKENWIRVENSG